MMTTMKLWFSGVPNNNQKKKKKENPKENRDSWTMYLNKNTKSYVLIWIKVTRTKEKKDNNRWTLMLNIARRIFIVSVTSSKWRTTKNERKRIMR